MSFSFVVGENENYFETKFDTIRYEKGLELELRFGDFVYQNSQTEFVPGVSQKDFTRLLKSLQNSSDFIVNPRSPLSETRVSYFEINRDKYRLIENIKNGISISQLVQQKNTKTKADARLFPYGVRLALSEEKNITDPQIIQKIFSQRPTSMKEQIRYIFSDKANNYEVHLSEIIKKGRKSFEIEIESNKDYLLQEDENGTRNYMRVMIIIFKLMTGRFSWMSKAIKNNYLNFIRNVVYNLRISSKIKTNEDKYVDNRPISLYYDNLNEIHEKKFAITNKLDGEFYNLIILSEGIFLVNNTTIDIIAEKDDIQGIDELSGNSILLGEWYEGVFHVFDAILINNKEVYNENLFDRLQEINIIENQLKQVNERFKINKKTFFYTSDINKDVASCLEYMKTTFGDNYINHNDGIIFTNVEGGAMAPTYKWKFPEKISIDGSLKIIEEDQATKTFEVFFTAKKDAPYEKLSSNPLLKVTNESPFFQVVKDNMIVELNWINDNLHIDRIRTDKYKPNNIFVAEKTLLQMKKPMTLTDLMQQMKPFDDTQNKNKRYRRFCNLIKKYLITTFSQNNVLDLGAGVGGDLQKYNVQFKNNVLKHLFLVEPFLFSGLQERLKEFQNENKNFVNIIKTLNEKAEAKDEIEAFLEGLPINVINMMFSLTFFGREEELIKLCNTLSLLQNDGLFVTTYMDGERTFNAIKENNGSIQGSFYKITDLEYAKTRNPTYNLNFDHKINFMFTGITVTEEGQNEFLIPTTQMRKRFSLLSGLRFNQGLFFDQLESITQDNSILKEALVLYKEMSEDEIQLVKLFRFDVYKKDMYKQKQQELIERENVLPALNVSDKVKRELIRLEFEKVGETFYRFGVLQDGSCFFHAFLQSVFFQKYFQKTAQERKNVISRLREKVAKNFDAGIWANVNKGNSAVNQLNEKIYNLIKNQKENVQKLEDVMNSLEQSNTYFVDYYKKVKSLKLNIDLKNLVDTCVDKIKTEYRNPSEWIRDDHFEYLTDVFQTNIFVVSDLTRDVYVGLYLEYKPQYPSIIMLNLNGKYGRSSPHFETIVQFKGNEAKSIFYDNDEIIQRLLARLRAPIAIEVESSQEIEIEEEEEYKEQKVKRDIDLEKHLTSIVEEFFMYKELNLTFEYYTIKKTKKTEYAEVENKEEEEVEIPYQMNEKEFLNYKKNYITLKKNYKLTRNQMDEIPFGYII